MTARENADAKDLAGRIILIVCREEYYPPALNSIYQQKREANSLPYVHKGLFIKGSPCGRAPAIAGERALCKNSSSVSLRLPPSPAGEGLYQVGAHDAPFYFISYSTVGADSISARIGYNVTFTQAQEDNILLYDNPIPPCHSERRA